MRRKILFVGLYNSLLAGCGNPGNELDKIVEESREPLSQRLTYLELSLTPNHQLPNTKSPNRGAAERPYRPSWHKTMRSPVIEPRARMIHGQSQTCIITTIKRLNQSTPTALIVLSCSRESARIFLITKRWSAVTTLRCLWAPPSAMLP
jgi:hypothetical protein